MMMILIRRGFSLVLLLSTFAFAAPAPFNIDPAHSQINFVAEAKFISCHGFFEKWDAEVNLDPQKIESSSVKINIDAASINTRIAQRDTHLKSKDFFAVDQYPKITFLSKSVSKTGASNYSVTGDLTIKGVTKEVQVPLEQVFYENNRSRFRGSFQISRKEFGVSFDSNMNPIQDMVKVQVDINVVKPKQPS